MFILNLGWQRGDSGLTNTGLERINLAEVPRIITGIPGENSRRILEEQHKMETETVTYPHSFPIAIKRADGSVIVDMDGNMFIDWFAGVSVLNLGYSNTIRKAIAEQLETVWHTLELPTEIRIKFLKELRKSFPSGLRDYKTIFGISGADACETAINLAHSASGRDVPTVAFDGAYHGASGGIISVTTGENYRVSVFSPGFKTVHVPYPYQLWDGTDVPEVHERLEGIFSGYHEEDRPDSLIVEPIQGEGGYVVPPHGFLKMLRDFCDDHRMLMIVDEIQSGMGRTGRMWAFEHEGISPDIVCVGKSVGGGIPISMVYYRNDLDGKLPTPFHMGTYRGNPLALAAGAELLREIPKHLDRVATKGEELMRSFSGIESPLIAEVRGKGFMIGVELAEDGKPLAKKRMLALKHAMLERGLMIHTCGKHSNVFRFMGALNIPDELLAKGIKIFEDGLNSNASFK